MAEELLQEGEETADQIQEQIRKLQERQLKAQLKEEDDDVDKVEMQLASVRIIVGKNSVTRKKVTPPEVALLVAEHHKKAGKMPIEDITLGDKIQVDPRQERNRLVAIYGAEKVNALFPGAIPTFPKSFRQAMSTGIDSVLPTKRMVEMDIAK